MKLITTVDIKPMPMIDYRSRVVMVGSCFAQNVGERMRRAGFDVLLNPNGISYNPMSIAAVLRRLVRGEEYTADDVREYDGRWVSMLHHGCFDGSDAELALGRIREAYEEARVALGEATHLIVTFGSSWVYELDGKVVNNCHKMPNKWFDERQLSVNEIVEEWRGLIGELRVFNAGLKLLFTVSPVRYMGRGAHRSQVNKATLLLAVDEICEGCDEALYFPSYEVVMDELRDYRFYAADMIHPSEQAVEYVWERFVEAYVTDEARREMAVVEKERRRSEHRLRG